MPSWAAVKPNRNAVVSVSDTRRAYHSTVAAPAAAATSRTSMNRRSSWDRSRLGVQNSARATPSSSPAARVSDPKYRRDGSLPGDASAIRRTVDATATPATRAIARRRLVHTSTNPASSGNAR